MDETKVQIGEEVLLNIGIHSEWYISSTGYDGESVDIKLRKKADRIQKWWFSEEYSLDGKPRGLTLQSSDGNAVDLVPAQKWIPCSERLPDLNENGVSDMVLLCWSDGQMTVGAYQGGRTFVGQAWPTARDCRVTVTAWQPLPTPWKGADDEDA